MTLAGRVARGMAAALALMLAAPAAAQTLATPAPAPAPAPVIRPGDDLSRLSDEDLRAALAALRERPPARVAILGIASGFGLAPGEAVLAAAATDRRDRGRRADFDGSVALAAGLGRVGGIGATTLVTITSVTPSKFGASGTVGLSFDRPISAGAVRGGVALGLGNLVRWGDSATLAPTASLAASAVAPIGGGMTVMGTLGWGTGVSDLGRAPGAFAGLGLGLSQRLAASAAWAGDEGILGLTAWLGRDGAAQVTVGIGDVTDAQRGRRFLLSFSWRFATLAAARTGG